MYDMAGSINRRTLVLCIAAQSRSDPVSREGRYPVKLSDTIYEKIVEVVRNLQNAWEVLTKVSAGCPVIGTTSHTPNSDARNHKNHVISLLFSAIQLPAKHLEEPFSIDSVFQNTWMQIHVFVAICCYMLLFVAICCSLVLFDAVCFYSLSLFVATCYWLLLFTVLICCYLLLFVAISK